MATTNPCSDKTLYASLRFCQGQKVIPGIRNHVYAISKRDIVTWPTLADPSDTAATLASVASYTGNFTLAADKKFVRIDLTFNKGNIECETQGEQPSVTFLNKLTASYPGTDEEAAGFCRLAADDDMVFLVPQRNGKYRVLGCAAFPCLVSPKQSTGEGTTTAGGTDLEIEATDICPAPFYPGTIETADDGDISGADGSAVTK